MGRFVTLLAGLLLGFTALGCSGRADAGPAWPKPSEREVDGGESLAPRRSTMVADSKDKPAAASDDDDDATAAEPDVEPASTPDDGSVEVDSEDDTITAPEETIDVDDLVIEIDDDDE